MPRLNIIIYSSEKNPIATRTKSEIGKDNNNKIIFTPKNCEVLLCFSLAIDLATNRELVPKSSNLDKETNKEVNKAYLPNSSRDKCLAIAVIKAKPKTALKTFPIPTSPILKNDFLTTK